MTGRVRVETGDSHPRLGDQLIDLVKAREPGAVTTEEFDSLRRQVLASLWQIPIPAGKREISIASSATSGFDKCVNVSQYPAFLYRFYA